VDPGEGRREGGSAALRGEGGAGDGDWKQHLQEAINRVPTPDAQRALDFARLRLGGQLEVTKDQLNEQYNRAIAKQGRLPHVLLHFVLRHCNGGEFTHPDLLASYIRGLLETSRFPPLTGDEVREKVIQYFEKRVLPHLKSVENDSVNQLDTMQKVINFSVLDLLDQDPRKHWDDIYELYQEDFSAATGRNDPTLCELGNRLDRFCRGFITIDAILSSCSFGVFFRMPSWLADFDYDIIQRRPSVQAELYALGYWSFDMIEGPETSLICGYNIGEPPPEAAEHADSKEKRDLVDDMSREYHSCTHGLIQPAPARLASTQVTAEEVAAAKLAEEQAAAKKTGGDEHAGGGDTHTYTHTHTPSSSRQGNKLVDRQAAEQLGVHQRHVCSCVCARGRAKSIRPGFGAVHDLCVCA